MGKRAMHDFPIGWGYNYAIYFVKVCVWEAGLKLFSSALYLLRYSRIHLNGQIN